MAVSALEAVFTELQKIYAKLCEIDAEKLMLIENSELFDPDDGMLNLITPVFDPVGTERNAPIEISIATQLLEFKEWLDDLLFAAYIVDPGAASDCEALNACARVQDINIIMATLNNVVFTPMQLSQRISGGIERIKNILLGKDSNLSPIEFESPKIWDEKGNLIIGDPDQKFLFSGADQDPVIQTIQDQVNENFQRILDALNKGTQPPASPNPP
jgi:hypothetical protein